MAELATPQFWVAVVEIIFVNILLSGDNAVVIALACRNLAPRQRPLGIFWGVLGAIGLRIVLTFFAMNLLGYPWLRLIGGALLLWIGVKLIAQDDGGEHNVKASDRLLTAVWTIVVADLVMSLDNVIAVAAAAGESTMLLILGLAISIPLVIFGATLLVKLMERWPIIITIGAALIGFVAGEMAWEDAAIKDFTSQYPAALKYVAAAVGAAFVVVVGRIFAGRTLEKSAEEQLDHLHETEDGIKASDATKDTAR